MKIPKSIKVGGRIYSVRFVKHLWRRSGFKGHIVFDTQEIELDDEIGEADVFTIFLHEAIHAIDKIFGENNLEESKVNMLAEGLYQVFSDMGITFTK